MALTLIGCCICDSLHQGQFGHLRSTSSALKDGAFLAEPLHQRPWLPAPPEFSKHSEPGALPISSNYLTASGDPIVTDHSTTSPANSMLAISENVACSGCPCK